MGLVLLFFVLFWAVFIIASEILISRMPPAALEEFIALDQRMSELEPLPETLYLFMMLCVAMFVSIIAGGLLAKRLTRPISNVAEVAQEAVAGNLNARATPLLNQQGNEISGLVDNFNTLLEMVQASETRLKADAAAIAHELRTPLSALQMRIHGLIDGVIEVAPHELERLLTQTQVLVRVVEDLGTLSLASRGEMVLSKSPTDLVELAGAAVALHARALEEAGIAVTIDGTHALADVDPNRLLQALSNLVENVTRYAAEGRVLQVQVARNEATFDISVSDRGDGIGLDFRTLMFEPFQREEASRSREFGGSGLGLSIVKAIALAHGGSVSAAPREGGGMSVILRIPAD